MKRATQFNMGSPTSKMLRWHASGNTIRFCFDPYYTIAPVGFFLIRLQSIKKVPDFFRHFYKNFRSLSEEFSSNLKVYQK
jgi:hypothetical protein